MQEDNEEKKSFKQKLIDFDWLTLILAIIVITVFTVDYSNYSFYCWYCWRNCNNDSKLIFEIYVILLFVNYIHC